MDQCNKLCFLLDSDLSSGYCYPPFEQPRKEVEKHQVSINKPNVIDAGCECGRVKMSVESFDLFCCIKH